MKSIKLMFSMVLIGMIGITACTSELEQTQEVKTKTITNKTADWQNNPEMLEAADYVDNYVETGGAECETCKCIVGWQYGNDYGVRCNVLGKWYLFVVTYENGAATNVNQVYP